MWIKVEVVLVDEASKFRRQVKEARELLVLFEKSDELSAVLPVSGTVCGDKTGLEPFVVLGLL